MKRREFIKNRIILFAAPAIIKIENLMKLAVPREISVIEIKAEGLDDFVRNIIWEIAKSANIPYDLLIRGTRPVTYKSIDPIIEA